MSWRGFELHPETPRGGVPVSALFPEPRLSGMREYMRRFAAEFGVEMEQPDRLPNTRRALAIAELARDRGLLETFREAAMRAHWRRGMDLEEDRDLRAIAGEVGLDPDEAIRSADDPEFQRRVDQMREEAMDRGVTGIPTFFFGERPVVGCQPYETLRRVAERAGVPRRS